MYDFECMNNCHTVHIGYPNRSFCFVTQRSHRVTMSVYLHIHLSQISKPRTANMMRMMADRGLYDLLQDCMKAGHYCDDRILHPTIKAKDLSTFKKLFLCRREAFETWERMLNVLRLCLESRATTILDFLVDEYPFLLEERAQVDGNETLVFDVKTRRHTVHWDHTLPEKIAIESWAWLLEHRPADFDLEINLRFARCSVKDPEMCTFLDKQLEELNRATNRMYAFVYI